MGFCGDDFRETDTAILLKKLRTVLSVMMQKWCSGVSPVALPACFFFIVYRLGTKRLEVHDIGVSVQKAVSLHSS